MKSPKSKIETALFDLKQTLEKIHGELANLRSASEAVSNQPATTEEKTKVFEAAIDDLAANGRKEWKSFITSPSLDQKTVADFFRPVFGEPVADFRHVIGNLLPLLGDEFKKKAPEFFASLAEPNQISEPARQKQIAEYATNRKVLERQEEDIYLELEGVGAVVDRRADMSPSIFLSLANGTYDEAKLRRLLRYVSAMAGEDAAMATAVNGSTAKILACKQQLTDVESRKQVTRPENYKAVTEKILGALAKEEKALAAIKASRPELDERRSRAINLANNSRAFLREKGIPFED